MTKSFFILVSSIFLSPELKAQVSVFEPVSPGVRFLDQRTYSEEAGKKYNSETYHTHPDFGKLTFDAPYGKNVAEDISKRTYDSRYYVDLDNPTYFYIQQAGAPINLFRDGFWRAIDPTLHAVSPQLYQSGVQACPTTLDIANKRTSFRLGETSFSFNNYSLKVVHTDNSVSTHPADWSQIVVGNEGAYITDVFPGIDMKIVFAEGKIESDFIVRENLHVKQLVFIDQLDLPAHLNGYIYTTQEAPHGVVIFENIYTGDAEVKFGAARCHDATDGKISWFSPYTLNGSKLEISCDSSYLNDPLTVYPVTVDPLVTVVGPIASANSLMGSLPSPSFCSNTINVTFPGGTTPWDVSATWNVGTTFCSSSGWDCWMSEAQVWITSSCGGVCPPGAPTTIWTCLAPGCDNPGTWSPTLPFATSGTQALAQCFTPSCSNQVLPFTINSNRSYCSGIVDDNCNWATNYCNYMNNWSVTVQGRNTETLGNTVTGNGSVTIMAPTCASGTTVLNPTPLYGVPGYTYAWSTGAGSSTITVPNAPTTYTATVTDACGTARTATFTIDCPLAIGLETFEAVKAGSEVNVTWTTSFEKENDYFTILRAGNDLVFEKIGQVSSQGDSEKSQNYVFTDRTPLNGINYYQLAVVDINDQATLSDIRSIELAGSSKEIAISPNPNSGNFTLELNIPEKGNYAVRITSAEGKVVFQQDYSFEKGRQILPFNKLSLQKGSYLVDVSNGKVHLKEKAVVE